MAEGNLNTPDFKELDSWMRRKIFHSCIDIFTRDKIAKESKEQDFRLLSAIDQDRFLNCLTIGEQINSSLNLQVLESLEDRTDEVQA